MNNNKLKDRIKEKLTKIAFNPASAQVPISNPDNKWMFSVPPTRDSFGTATENLIRSANQDITEPGILGQGLSQMPEYGQKALDYAAENPWTAAAIAGVPLGMGAIGAKRALFGGGAPSMPPPKPGGLSGMWAGLSPGAKLAAGLGGAGLGYYGLQKLMGGGEPQKKKITLSV